MSPGGSDGIENRTVKLRGPLKDPHLHSLAPPVTLSRCTYGMSSPEGDTVPESFREDRSEAGSNVITFANLAPLGKYYS